MKIIVKNKFISWGGSSKVEDEHGKALYKVKGKAFSWTRKKILKDLNGNVLYIIKNKWPTWLLHSAYICDSRGNKICRVRQNIKFNEIYKVEETRDEIKVIGNPWDGMQVARNGQYIGTVTRKILSFTDTFILELLDGQDPAFLIAMTIAFDNIQDKSNNQSR